MQLAEHVEGRGRAIDVLIDGDGYRFYGRKVLTIDVIELSPPLPLNRIGCQDSERRDDSEDCRGDYPTQADRLRQG